MQSVPGPAQPAPAPRFRYDDVVKRAHQLGLVVHPFTFRNEAKLLAANFQDNPAEEYRLFFELGVDGVFSDFTDTAVATRTLMQMR